MLWSGVLGEERQKLAQGCACGDGAKRSLQAGKEETFLPRAGSGLLEGGVEDGAQTEN